ncbi:glutamate-1-semialdehyde 2,1-aminomutase [Blastopirellula sp. JC732]|uniref:Glutamate-1-semialdehyde 2,1-aminomutase n=1 Tax=Blastopirellula sediminis TaxID=2894196 RepID=A0A9X1SFL5_9BACT|nr:glutamate-1-semialdehyde 2,1-aminomutase [Blastopirellula sediminis]MCC9609568.1 glutamate-1-semialdehyde 2,1-aminomutase [Blastopirellula sediminis]MCC9627656.1 glutamate-1-semialdehyde 2,1-aminomutase [Blastopirellula sediminis]
MSRSRSHEIFQRALELMPGGVNSPARAFGGVGGEPLVFERGEGAYLFDVDGNRYIDYIGSWGPMILGHGNEKVRAAIHAAVDQGTSFGAPTERENQLAELIIDIVPSVEKVRLVNSGTEATMSAIRVARGYTGRNKIIKFAGNYHGHVDSLLVAAGSAAATLGVPNSPGVTPGTTADTIVLPYNSVEALTSTFEKYGDELACVIFEPIVGNMGTVIPTPEFLGAIRELCTKYGAVMLMDEVMTGFRVALGGAQELFGVTPDLTTMGKIVGGGLPIAAYGGRADIMNNVLPAGKVFQAGTLSGNPLATAAGIATLSILKETNPYPQLEKLGERLMTGLAKAASDAGVAHSVARVGSMATLFFGEGPIVDWDTAAKSDTKRYADFFWGLIDRGVYFPCSQFEALFISVTHTDADIDATIAAAREALKA